MIMDLYFNRTLKTIINKKINLQNKQENGELICYKIIRNKIVE